MLKKEIIEKLATLVKLPAAELETAIKATDEVDVKIPEGLTTFTEAEVTTLKNNEYKNGKEKGTEMLVKETKDKLGLDFQGRTLDGLLDAHAKKVLADAKIEPQKKVTELEEQLATVKGTAKTLQEQLAAKDKEIEGVKIHGELAKYVPAPGENGPAIGADDVIALMKASGYGFELKDGKMVATKDGKVLQNNLSEALPPAEVVTGFLKEKKLIAEAAQQPAGRGGAGSGKAVKVTKLSELTEQFKAQGKNTLGEEFNKAVEAAAKDNPEFDMNA